jgi:hypothetical protein
VQVGRAGTPQSNLSLDPEYVPCTRHTLERLWTKIGEAETRPRHKIFYGAGHEYFAGFRESRDTRADMDGDAAEVVPDFLALASMQTATYLDPK